MLLTLVRNASPNQHRSANADADRRLVAAALQGDRAAFDALVEAHWRKIGSIVRHLIQDRTEAEDALQETFVRAFEGLAAFRGDSSVQTWLIRIAINVARNRSQTFWRRRVTVSSDAVHGTSEPPFAPDATLLYGEWQRTVNCALGALAEKQRLPILLHFFEDLSGAEIAHVLGCKESTVWTRIYAGLKQLRKTLEPWSQG